MTSKLNILFFSLGEYHKWCLPSSYTVQFSSVAQSLETLCEPLDCSTPDLPVHHQLPEYTQIHVH